MAVWLREEIPGWGKTLQELRPKGREDQRTDAGDNGSDLSIPPKNKRVDQKDHQQNGSKGVPEQPKEKWEIH